MNLDVKRLSIVQHNAAQVVAECLRYTNDQLESVGPIEPGGMEYTIIIHGVTGNCIALAVNGVPFLAMVTIADDGMMRF